MYRTLKLVDGDISFGNLGKLEWIEDIDSLKQTIYIKLNTLKNELFYNENFGIEDLTTLKNLPNYYDFIGYSIQEALIDYEKIVDVNIINIINTSTSGISKVDIEIEVILSDDTKLYIAYSI